MMHINSSARYKSTWSGLRLRDDESNVGCFIPDNPDSGSIEFDGLISTTFQGFRPKPLLPALGQVSKL